MQPERGRLLEWVQDKGLGAISSGAAEMPDDLFVLTQLEAALDQGRARYVAAQVL